MKIKKFTYTKANGDVSERTAIVVSVPRDNYLVYDVSDLTEEEVENLREKLAYSESIRETELESFTEETGINSNNLWRSFKPGGIDWEE